MYKLSITETGRSTLKEEASIFNKDEQTFTTLQEVKEAIIERYGKLPKRTLANTIFIDDEEGNLNPLVFFTHSGTRIGRTIARPGFRQIGFVLPPLRNSQY